MWLLTHLSCWKAVMITKLIFIFDLKINKAQLLYYFYSHFLCNFPVLFLQCFLIWMPICCFAVVAFNAMKSIVGFNFCLFGGFVLSLLCFLLFILLIPFKEDLAPIILWPIVPSSTFRRISSNHPSPGSIENICSLLLLLLICINLNWIEGAASVLSKCA